MKIKIISGFRDNQYYIIDANEAHKAYYLFNNPEARTTFSNGVALIGKNIQGIEPAYNETMGWNPTHKLDDYDWNELRAKGVDVKLRNILAEGKRIAYLAVENPQMLNKTLSEATLLLK
jgi:hypothetical protein